MIEGINDSKKAFFIWLTVFVVLFAGIFIGLGYLFTTQNGFPPESIPNVWEKLLIAYLLATIPIGVASRSKFLEPHYIPNLFSWEQDKDAIRSGSIVRMLFHNIALSFRVFGNGFIFLFFVALSILFGWFMMIYFLISGIVFLITKKI